jgi:hypothetical protein
MMLQLAAHPESPPLIPTPSRSSRLPSAHPNPFPLIPTKVGIQEASWDRIQPCAADIPHR